MSKPLSSVLALTAAGALLASPMLVSAQGMSDTPAPHRAASHPERGDATAPMSNKAGKPPTAVEAQPRTADRPAKPGAQGGARTAPDSMNGNADTPSQGMSQGQRTQEGTRSGHDRKSMNADDDMKHQGSGSQPDTVGRAASEPLMGDKDVTGSKGTRGSQ